MATFMHGWTTAIERDPHAGATTIENMEPRGCNRWQIEANRIVGEAAETSQDRCRGFHRLLMGAHGKEEVTVWDDAVG